MFHLNPTINLTFLEPSSQHDFLIRPPTRPKRPKALCRCTCGTQPRRRTPVGGRERAWWFATGNQTWPAGKKSRFIGQIIEWEDLALPFLTFFDHRRVYVYIYIFCGSFQYMEDHTPPPEIPLTNQPPWRDHRSWTLFWHCSFWSSAFHVARWLYKYHPVIKHSHWKWPFMSFCH